MQQHWQRLSSGAIGVIGDTIGTNLEVQELTPVGDLIIMLDDVTRHCWLSDIQPARQHIVYEQYQIYKGHIARRLSALQSRQE